MPLLRSGQDAAALSGSAPAVSMVGGTTQRAADTTVPVVTSSLYLQLADVDGVSVYNFPALDAHFRVQEEHKHTLVRLHGVERTASAIRGVQVVDCLPVDGACVSSFGRSASQSASAHFPGLKDNDTQCTARFLSPRRASMTRLFMQVSVRVCLKFVPHPSPGHVVHHKNSRPEDNHACNLATGTQSETCLRECVCHGSERVRRWRAGLWRRAPCGSSAPLTNRRALVGAWDGDAKGNRQRLLPPRCQQRGHHLHVSRMAVRRAR